MLDLYYWPTPNGKKVTIQLEECQLDYNVIQVNIGKGDQFSDEFLKICPNNRMPALVDRNPAESGGEPISIFESGTIMLYLAEKTGQFMPTDLRGKYNVMQWVVWQMANQGPKTGECGHFRRLNDSLGDQSYAVSRFTDEVNRFYGVLNNQLYNQRYVCGDEYTIADMICYPWTVNWQGQGQDIDHFKYFKRWFQELSERPAVIKGMAIGSDFGNDYSKMSKSEIEALKKMLYNQRARPAPETGGIEA
ncbi:MAG: glutathione S-transferase N-terminal domain-containing protein [bacterium]|nr:glutathione S-transferase family protein [Gammaproteobacteria bacterium]HIL95498.1 glutathione S-transferase family protein [Pseudomonadales bacterium]